MEKMDVSESTENLPDFYLKVILIGRREGKLKLTK